jgi:hypothetical protein
VASQSGAGTASSLSQATNSVSTSGSAAASPPAYPVLLGSRLTSGADGCAASRSAVPSSEALSTTTSRCGLV